MSIQKKKHAMENFEAVKSEVTPLSELSIGESGFIHRISAKIRNLKKFADIGFIHGENVKMENRAPFGGLLRVNIMNTSISLHHDEAQHILIHKQFDNHHDQPHHGHSHHAPHGEKQP